MSRVTATDDPEAGTLSISLGFIVLRARIQPKTGIERTLLRRKHAASPAPQGRLPVPHFRNILQAAAPYRPKVAPPQRTNQGRPPVVGSWQDRKDSVAFT